MLSRPSSISSPFLKSEMINSIAFLKTISILGITLPLLALACKNFSNVSCSSSSEYSSIWGALYIVLAKMECSPVAGPPCNKPITVSEPSVMIITGEPDIPFAVGHVTQISSPILKILPLDDMRPDKSHNESLIVAISVFSASGATYVKVLILRSAG